MPKRQGAEYSETEAAERLAKALRGAQVVGHKPQSEMKIGKRQATQSPRAREAKKKKPSQKTRPGG